jgi:hypothetical protein
MKRMNLITALATLLLVVGCTAASAEDTTTKATPPTYGPGWRHEQMMQARAANGQWGPGMGYGMGMGYGRMQGGGGPPLKADGTIDTTRLPDWCPLKTATPVK